MTETIDPIQMLIALAAGVAVAAACGLRAFLPLLILGAASRFGWVDLHPGVMWLGKTPVLVALTIATVLELLADKVPVVDHVLDSVATLIRPLSGAIASFALLLHWPEPWAGIVAVILGGGALAMHALKAKVRLGSTATTLGHGNPFISAFEDITVTGLVIGAILVPVAILIVLFAVVMLALRAGGRPGGPVRTTPGGAAT